MLAIFIFIKLQIWFMVIVIDNKLQTHIKIESWAKKGKLK